jgi:hypothetical protein
MLDPVNRGGSNQSFRTYIIKSIEDNLKLADEENTEECCVIYDRRGLEFANIDPNLYQYCRTTIQDLQKWYVDATYCV